jgi:hypothetical protein
VLLSSTSGNDITTDDLTATWDTYDPNDDPVKSIVNWYLDDTSISVLNMPFEADGDQNATDYSTFGNDGTVHGATWNANAGYDGFGAYQFDGTGDHIQVNYEPSLDLQTAFTLSAWINAGSTGSYQTIINKEHVSDSYRDRNFWLTLWTDGTLHLRFSSSTNNLECDVADNIDLRNTGWRHVVGVYDGSACSVYLDGIFQDSDPTLITNPPEGIGDDLHIGGEIGTSSRFFNGSIDEVMIYDHALSAEQIKALYESRTDLIVSQETSVGDTWSTCITPNDGIEDGAEVCSNELTIVSD